MRLFETMLLLHKGSNTQYSGQFPISGWKILESKNELIAEEVIGCGGRAVPQRISSCRMAWHLCHPMCKNISSTLKTWIQDLKDKVAESTLFGW